MVCPAAGPCGPCRWRRERGGDVSIQMPAAAADPADGEGSAAAKGSCGPCRWRRERGGNVSIQIPASAADPADGEASAAAKAEKAAAKAEKRLNFFVRVLATLELVGNALGTLASLWASVVLIGGYRSKLEHVDFWIATLLIFIEAFRAFTRNFKLDNQSLFGSTKALRGISSSFARMLCQPRDGNELLLVISWVILIFHPVGRLGEIGMFCQMAVLAVMTRMQVTEAPRLMKQLREKRPLLLWVVLIILPAIAILTVPFTIGAVSYGFTDGAIAALVALRDIIAQFVAVVLLNCRPQCITTLTRCPWGQRILDGFKLISAISSVASIFPLTMQLATVVLLFSSLQDKEVVNSRFGRLIDMVMNICFLWALVLTFPGNFSPSGLILLLVLLIGNLQIPAAVAQTGLSSWRLAILHGDGLNMKASIAVFYALELCQGSLYIAACVIALCSCFPRRLLVNRLKFGGKRGDKAKAVDLYYERAYTTRMEAGVFAEDTISLASFAVDSLNSTSSRDKQLAGVRVLHSLLQQKHSSQEIISVVTRSETAVPTLISMLGWRFEEDRDIRLYAAMVTKELSSVLRIDRTPGAVKLVSSLLDAEKHSVSENNEGGRNHDDPGSLGPQANGDNQIGGSTGNNGNNQPQDGESSGNYNGRNVSNRPAHEQSEHRRSKLDVLLSWVKKKRSIPDEQPLTSSLPVLGLEILERLACDADNCAEIMKVTNLVPKIIGLTSYSSNNESSTDNALMSSSLNLLRRLATTNGKIGANIRQELWDSPFLVCNLAGILENNRSPEVLKPAMDIIAIMAWDEVVRHELGSVQVIIHKLVHVFIVGQDESTNYDQSVQVAAGEARQDGSTNYDQSVRVAAGEALTNLAMESPANCLAIMEERRPGCKLVKDLKDMLGKDEYRCVAASLLQNLCACSRIRDRLRGPEASKHLTSDALLVVLKNIMAAEGKQLEALIGLTSQICYVLPPQCFVQGLESRIIGETCVKLVDTLNSNKRPSHEYPRMRRAIVEMVISILGRYPHYAINFRREGMMDALSKAETNPSRVENYRVFLGNDGVVLERGLPLRDLVARARGLIDSLITLTPGAQPMDHAL